MTNFNKTAVSSEDIMKKYQACDLDGKMNDHVFKLAMTGLNYIVAPNDSIISIVDFSLPSTEKRFYLIDLKKEKLLINTYVSHGVNTGGDMAVSFSNKNGSRKSSIGFYMTAETYEGKHGLSLRLDGLEHGFNSRARRRYIVLHSASYVSEEFIKENGRLGRSWGCPALPLEVTPAVIDIVKEGSVLFIYGQDQRYFSKSKFLLKR